MVDNNKRRRSTLWAFWICTLGSTFYIYDFFIRVSPSVMTQELMRDLHIYAPGLGVISSILFLTYTLMQIPAGLLIDRFGVKRPLITAVLACGAATLVFSYAKTAWVAATMFGVVGITAGFAYIVALVLAARWFSVRYFAMIAGLVQFMGCMGAIGAQAPLQYSILMWGWRETMRGAAATGFILALLYALFIQEYPDGHHPIAPTIRNFREELKILLSGLFKVLRDRQNWWIATYILLIWTPASVFTSLWGISAIQALFGLSPGKASLVGSSVWVGIALAGPFWGWWSDHIKRRCLPAVLAAGIGLLSTMIFMDLPRTNSNALIALLFLFGSASAAQVLSFALIRDNNHDSVVGTAVGFTNMMCVLGTPIFQPIISLLLQHYWHGEIRSGVPLYSASDFKAALSCIPILYFAALIVALFFIKETHCESRFNGQSE